MRLIQVKLLSDFRGLPKNYSLKFWEGKSTGKGIEPRCFIGLNGSGKSNILEAISEMFYYLESISKVGKKHYNDFKTDFGFEIQYSLPKMTFAEIDFKFEELADLSYRDFDKLIVKIKKKPKELPQLVLSNGVAEKNDFLIEEHLNMVLPRYIVGYSSGINELLSNPFVKINFEYYEELKSKIDNADRSTLDINRMFYLNYNSSKLVSIASFIFDSYGLEYIKSELGIEKISTFSLNIYLAKYKQSQSYLPSELNLAVESFKRLDPLFEETLDTNLKYTDRIRYKFNFDINSDLRIAFKEEFKSAYNLFRILYNFQNLNLALVGKNTRRKVRNSQASSIDNLSEAIPKKEKNKLLFSIDKLSFIKSKTKDKVYFKQLSDGEHQMLQILSSITLLDSNSTLFLFDEPTTHFNPEWRSKFIYSINKCIEGAEQREQEILLTTHSPFIVSDSQRENVIHTLNDKIKKHVTPVDQTYGASIRFLLSKLFNQKNSIGQFSLEDLKNLSEEIDRISNRVDVDNIKDRSNMFGNSPEKIILFNKLSQKIQELEIQE